jgi:hypothetical protein
LEAEKLEKLIKEKKAQEIREAADGLADPSRANPVEIAERIKAYQTILEAIRKPPSHRWIPVAVISILCVSIVLFLAKAPMPRSKVLLQVTAEGVKVDLTEPLILSGPSGVDLNYLSVDNLNDIIGSPVLGLSIKNPVPEAWIHVRKGNIRLTELKVLPERREKGEGYPLEIQLYGKKMLQMALGSGSLTGRFLVSKNVDISARKASDSPPSRIVRHLSIPESISFRAMSSTTLPVDLNMELRGPLVLWNLEVKTIRFSRRISPSPGETSFASTIQSGFLKLHDLSRDVVLREKSQLSLIGLKGRIVELHGGDTIQVAFEGTVKSVLLGPEGFQENVTPRCLEYLYHNRPLSLFWSALVFAWGMLWGLRKILSQIM